MFSCRGCTEADADLILNLARACPPLDVHTAYTYWVVCHLYGGTSSILMDDQEAVGYIMGVPKDRTLFIWQLGVLPRYRGQGLTALLFNALLSSSASRFDEIELTIAPDNNASFGALASWSRANGLRIEELGIIAVPEHHEPGEILYRLQLHGATRPD